MRAGIWFTAGAAAGVYGMVKVRRIAEAFTPDGMRDRIGAAVVGARIFRDEVAHGQADAETQLRERLRDLEAGSRRGAPRPELDPSTTTTARRAALSTTDQENPA